MNQIVEKVEREFVAHVGGQGVFVKSPGRVNLIGGHTDYNAGFVLPLAIDKSIVLAMAANSSGRGRFYAIDKEEHFEADLTGTLEKSGKGWPDYLLGVVDRLRKHGYTVDGFDCVFASDIPIGAGLSSSAALEGGVLFGLAQINGWDMSPVDMARIAQEAENKFVGVQCGIMDQFISLNGKEKQAMKLDCRSLEYENCPFDDNGVHIVLCDTKVRRELASSEYNLRRKQCEDAVKTLQNYDPGIRTLRDVSLDFLKAHQDALDSTVLKRCEYIVEENDRVLQAFNDLQNNDLQALGRRIFSSHAGLRDKYEVSCRELDVLVDAAHKIDGVFGARMMGGGFGGCTINIVESSKLAAFCDQIQQDYLAAIDQTIDIYKTKASGGTHRIQKDNA